MFVWGNGKLATMPRLPRSSEPRSPEQTGTGTYLHVHFKNTVLKLHNLTDRWDIQDYIVLYVTLKLI